MNKLPSTRREGRKPALRMSTGVSGLDDILFGGLTAERIYLVEGSPGTGKTTLGLQFLLEGLRRGEHGLYITLSETADELDAVAESHGWSIEKLSIYELADEGDFHAESQQSILHPSEIELGETSKGVMDQVDRDKPVRVVFDSLSEMRLLAQNPLRYRRQILGLKQFFSTRGCTVLLLDDKTSKADQHLHSIAHGVLSLEQMPQEYGKERRRVNVIKMRGIKFRGGYHDYALETGGIRMFPRLVASEQELEVALVTKSTGSAALDDLLGGGVISGTSTLVMGPAGVGKTTIAARCMLAALERGEKASFFLFEEGRATFLARNASLGQDLRPHIDSGFLDLRHVDPAELSPGEFAQIVRDAVEIDGAKFIVIDSLNSYLKAMPGEQFLILQMHELLSFLNQKSVATMLVLAEHGIIGDLQREVDLSYLSDSTMLLRYFESGAKLRRAITVVKSRTSNHALTIHELALSSGGIEVGGALEGFEGVLTGLPNYRGTTAMMVSRGDDEG